MSCPNESSFEIESKSDILPKESIMFPGDKRPRNPNWTDFEVIRFLEILQEGDVLKDLSSQRNKQVFCQVSIRMAKEGADKSWDQCRIKLKNLKSQYRYMKDRIPNLESLDLEDDSVISKLVVECQGRGISPSSIKHLRYLARFIKKQNSDHPNFMDFGNNESYIHSTESMSEMNESDGDDPVSPPRTPSDPSQNFAEEEQDEVEDEVENVEEKNGEFKPCKRRRILRNVTKEIQEGYQFIEKFNQDMMKQFMEQQKTSQSNFLRWEEERFKLEQRSLERWRQEARDHEKHLFGMFCHVMTAANSALNTILKTAQSAASASSYCQSDNALEESK